jgi:hypothetical protein
VTRSARGQAPAASSRPRARPTPGPRQLSARGPTISATGPGRAPHRAAPSRSMPARWRARIRGAPSRDPAV